MSSECMQEFILAPVSVNNIANIALTSWPSSEKKPPGRKTEVREEKGPSSFY